MFQFDRESAVETGRTDADQTTGTEGEQFVTFFDSRFILHGLALHESLRRWCPGACLWVLCLDERVERQLEALALPGLRVLPVTLLDAPELREARANRSKTEFIYTLTPFTYEFVAKAAPAVRRITYVDADVYLFGSPTPLFAELDATGKSVLMTEHGYSPAYSKLEAQSGRFCVQFLPVVWDERGQAVIRDWRARCLAGTGTASAGREEVFGDQKYLEAWPRQFASSVHVSRATTDLLGPWNAQYVQGALGPAHRPIIYHFHSFRILPGGWLQLCAGYRVGAALSLYDEYVEALQRQRARLHSAGVQEFRVGAPGERFWRLRLGWRVVTRRIVLRRWTRAG